MLKETVICLIIVISIVCLEIYTQKFTSKTVEEVTDIFNEIEELISRQEFEKLNNELENIGNKWEEKQKKLAYYIEHDELEKVYTSIVEMKSYVKSQNFSSAMAELEEGKFVIEHIQEKNSFNLQNIF